MINKGSTGNTAEDTAEAIRQILHYAKLKQTSVDINIHRCNSKDIGEIKKRLPGWEYIQFMDNCKCLNIKVITHPNEFTVSLFLEEKGGE